MSQPRTHTSVLGLVPPGKDTWYYPPELANDMEDVHYLSADVKAQLLTSGWEAVRSGTPHYTNWERYLALVRLYIISFFCDFNGQMVNLLASDKILGYSLSSLLDTLFGAMSVRVRESMEREVRCALFFQAEKSSNRRNGELFRRYANSLAQSPRQWFLMRTCDGMGRVSMMAALACNDILDVSFSEAQWEILGEITWTMYDAVAFYKHRSEGEVCNTFAYIPEMRVKAFWQCREVLWALDTAWARETSLRPILNNLRLLGGTVHMLIRRYPFVENNLCLGVQETEETVSHARGNFKLWYRITPNDSELKDVSGESIQYYEDVLDRREELLIPGLAVILETSDDRRCDTCLYPDSYATEAPIYSFSGVQLCDKCKPQWRDFLESLPERAAKAFPELVETYKKGITSARIVE
ncbi:BcABA3 [Mycena rebaudengoi]|nr:BcABA3 [Mycena rebaudengoi]